MGVRKCVYTILLAISLLPEAAVIFHMLVPLSNSFVLALFLHYDLQVNDQTTIVICKNSLLPYQKELVSARLVRVVLGSVLSMGILLY